MNTRNPRKYHRFVSVHANRDTIVANGYNDDDDNVDCMCWLHHQLHLLLIPFPFNFTQLTIDDLGFSGGFTFRSQDVEGVKVSDSKRKSVENDTNMKTNHICIHIY